jgi:hypothetical protein
MAKKKILPFKHPSAWATQYDFYLSTAQKFLQQAIQLNASLENRIEELEKKLRVEQATLDESTITSYIVHITESDTNQLDAVCVATQIFACMAVEAFLNYYGVRRLGEEFYKRNLERLGINQKLEILITICTQELVEDKDEIVLIVKRMFDRRNSLVHPKSKKVGLINGKFVFPEPINHLEQAEQAVREMKLFFEKFEELDEGIKLGNVIGG